MDIEKPLVSVIVPIYGVEKYLDDCISSLIHQTYTNLEILLIDDGSPDGCPRICDMWAERDKRIRVFHKHNGGLSDARNYGIDRAHGKYIYCIDSDDWVDTSLVEKCINICIRDNADVVIFGNSTATEDGKIIKNGTDADKLPPQGIYSPNDILKLLWEDKLQSHAWSFITKKSIYSTDIRYPVNYLMEDIGTTYLLWARAKNICVLPEIFYYYRNRGNSIVNTRNPKICYDTLHHIRNVDKYVEKNLPQLQKYELDWSVRYLSSCLIWAYEAKTRFPLNEYHEFVSLDRQLLRARINRIGITHLSPTTRIKAVGLLLHLTPAVVLVSQMKDSLSKQTIAPTSN